MAVTHSLGKVENMGPDVPPNLKSGNVVLFSKHAGNKIKDEDIDYVLIEEQQILATC